MWTNENRCLYDRSHLRVVSQFQILDGPQSYPVLERRNSSVTIPAVS